MRISDATSSIAPQKSSAISDTIQNDADAFHILDLSIADNPFFSFEYNRKIFYTATLLQGEYRLELKCDPKLIDELREHEGINSYSGSKKLTQLYQLISCGDQQSIKI